MNNIFEYEEEMLPHEEEMLPHLLYFWSLPNTTVCSQS